MTALGSSNNAHATQLAISGIRVEGLLRLAARTMGPAEPDDCEADFAASDKWIESQPAGLTPQFLARLGGLRPSFTSLGPKDIFRNRIR